MMQQGYQRGNDALEWVLGVLLYELMTDLE